MFRDILIIGNGPAGTNAALTLRSLDPNTQIIMVSHESLYFYSRPALMYLYLGSLRFKDVMPYEKKFWQKQKIELLQDEVLEISPQEKYVVTKKGLKISFQACLLALGAEAKKLGVPNENCHGVLHFTNLFDLEILQKLTKNPKKISRALVIGGGLIGVEVAEILTLRKIPVTFLVKENYFYPKALSSKEGFLVEKEIRNHKVELLFNTEVSQFVADDGKLKGVYLKNGKYLEADLAIVAIGVNPRKELAEKSGILCHEGIAVGRELMTNFPGIFAAGDVAEVFLEKNKSEIYLLWYTAEKMGKLAGENLYLYLKGKPLKKWEMGLWYNSAKFFNLEWQYFGLKPLKDKNEKEFFWEFSGGEKLLRVVTNESGQVTALSSLGLRLRESFCREMLIQKKDIHYLKINSSNLFYDPEFFPNFQKELLNYALS